MALDLEMKIGMETWLHLEVGKGLSLGNRWP